MQLVLCQQCSMSKGPSTCSFLLWEVPVLTWYEAHVEGYQAPAVVDGGAGPVSVGQPLAQGTDGVSKQELERQVLTCGAPTR